jgi:hypothetical protein
VAVDRAIGGAGYGVRQRGLQLAQFLAHDNLAGYAALDETGRTLTAACQPLFVIKWVEAAIGLEVEWRAEFVLTLVIKG